MNYKKKILTNKREKRGFTEYPRKIANVLTWERKILGRSFFVCVHILQPLFVK